MTAARHDCTASREIRCTLHLMFSCVPVVFARWWHRPFRLQPEVSGSSLKAPSSPINTSGVPADLGRAVLMLLAPVSKSLPMQPTWGPNETALPRFSCSDRLRLSCPWTRMGVPQNLVTRARAGPSGEVGLPHHPRTAAETTSRSL